MDKYNLFDVRVAGFIFNDKQELLLLKNRQGTWGILGGHLEKGEILEIPSLLVLLVNMLKEVLFYSQRRFKITNGFCLMN
ncbi:MAG: NUDIX hydrolase [Candidatus Diapherotrites archaeon]|nr:NUDIX hydrolase [Candidatus Diapherotrites archaeon]